jgi:hypothetical protein
MTPQAAADGFDAAEVWVVVPGLGCGDVLGTPSWFTDRQSRGGAANSGAVSVTAHEKVGAPVRLPAIIIVNIGFDLA